MKRYLLVLFIRHKRKRYDCSINYSQYFHKDVLWVRKNKNIIKVCVLVCCWSIPIFRSNQVFNLIKHEFDCLLFLTSCLLTFNILIISVLYVRQSHVVLRTNTKLDDLLSRLYFDRSRCHQSCNQTFKNQTLSP